MQQFTGIIKVDKFFREMDDECFCASNSQEYPNHTKTEFGSEILIDLYGVGKDILSSKDLLLEYCDIILNITSSKLLSDKIVIVNPDEGSFNNLSLVVVTDVGSVTIHFSVILMQVHISIISTSKVDSDKIKEMSENFFKSKDFKMQLIIR